jgi:hypothetical protein
MGLGDYAVGEMSSVSRKLAICALVGRDQAEVARARPGSVTLPVIVGFVIACAGDAAFEAAAGLRSLSPPTGLALLALVMALADQSRLYNRLVCRGYG